MAGTGGVVTRVALSKRLRQLAKVTLVSAPPGSGKTVLLRSWIREEALGDRVAWVGAGRDVAGPQRFWLSVVDALRGTAPGAGLVQSVSAAPGTDGWALVERLLNDLAPLNEPVWLVIDDVHELDPDLLLRQLELLVMRAPQELRFVLAARRDVRLGLHRLRLEGELCEIREADLRFSLAEARELFAGADVELPAASLKILHQRTEGWAAGLRLAALSLAGHPDPERFAEEFSGSERTVSDYLLAEVLDRQSEPVRQLLLRTSIADRINGELADVLTGGTGGERILQDLEQANAFVVSLDAGRSEFRYHQMFADLLQLELRRAAPADVRALHRAAAGWCAEHGNTVEAIRHAQAAEDWPMAGQLFADHWSRVWLGGHVGTVQELLAGFPPRVRAADAELATLCAGEELVHGSMEEAERYLDLAERGSATVPDGRRGQFQVLLGVVRLLLARRRGRSLAVAEEARRLQAMTDALDEDLRALVLIIGGITEFSVGELDQGERYLDQGVVLAQQTGRPYLEFVCLARQAGIEVYRSFARAEELSLRVVELAECHGWTDEPAAGVAYGSLAAMLAWQGHPEQAEPWARRAERTVTAEAEPAVRLGLHHVRGLVELARGRHEEALAAFQAAERVAGRPPARHLRASDTRALLMHALVRIGKLERAEQALAELGETECEGGEMRVAAASLRLAQRDPEGAIALLGPVLDGSAPASAPTWSARAFLLEAIARDALGDLGAARRGLERALDLAEPDGVRLVFLLDPASALLERQSGHRGSHASLIAEILAMLGDPEGSPSGGRGDGQSGSWGDRFPRLTEPLSQSELRVLRYLPTNLTGPEIARELHVSYNTVKSQIASLYVKIGTHGRAETVDHARGLGLLAPSARPR